MKPTKNRVYCKDSGRVKMVFETEKKANTFIKFNSEDIKSESGYSPTRSYHCLYCNAWHVTSKNEKTVDKSTTEIVLDRYREEKENRSIMKAKAAEARQARRAALNRHFESIEKMIVGLEAALTERSKSRCIEILHNAYSELELTRTFTGGNNKRKVIENKLALLKSEIENIA